MTQAVSCSPGGRPPHPPAGLARGLRLSVPLSQAGWSRRDGRDGPSRNPVPEVAEPKGSPEISQPRRLGYKTHWPRSAHTSGGPIRLPDAPAGREAVARPAPPRWRRVSGSRAGAVSQLSGVSGPRAQAGVCPQAASHRSRSASPTQQRRGPPPQGSGHENGQSDTAC